jgi:hypothetical protein
MFFLEKNCAVAIVQLCIGILWQDHSHKVSGSMGSRYGVAVHGTRLARDFYTSGRKWTREPGSGSTNPGRGSKVVNPFYVTMGKTKLVVRPAPVTAQKIEKPNFQHD